MRKLLLMIFLVISICTPMLMKPVTMSECTILISSPELNSYYNSGPPYEGVWLKGDAHMHTNFSDGGPNTVDDRARQARKNNLDFIVITDHITAGIDRKILDACYKAVLSANAAYPNLIVLWGFEWSYKWHILGYGLTPDEMRYISEDAQKEITAIHNAGGVAFFAHPAWSNAGYRDLYAFENLTGFEGFNYGFMESFIKVGREWDQLLMAGKSYVIVGGSDAHGEEEAGQWGATFIYCPNATEKGIIEGYKRACIYFSESIFVNNSWKPIFRMEFTVNSTWMGQTLLPHPEINEFTARLWINVTVVEGDSKIDTVAVIQNGEAVRYISGKDSTNITLYLDIPNVTVPSYFRIMANSTAGKYVLSNPVFLGKFAKSEEGGVIDPRLLTFSLIIAGGIIIIFVKASMKERRSFFNKTDVWKNCRDNYNLYKHTLKLLSEEHWFPDLIDRKRYERWKAEGAKDMLTRTREKLLKFLSEHEPEPLLKDILKELK